MFWMTENSNRRNRIKEIRNYRRESTILTMRHHIKEFLIDSMATEIHNRKDQTEERILGSLTTPKYRILWHNIQETKNRRAILIE